MEGTSLTLGRGGSTMSIGVLSSVYSPPNILGAIVTEVLLEGWETDFPIVYSTARPNSHFAYLRYEQDIILSNKYKRLKHGLLLKITWHSHCNCKGKAVWRNEVNSMKRFYFWSHVPAFNVQVWEFFIVVACGRWRLSIRR